jgi:peptide/nickel transport system substrate-binding protein
LVVRGLLPAPIAAALVMSFVSGATADETPKRGGTLTFMIPADAPPSFDGHKESTFATVHAFAPFYSQLVRINPENPSSTVDIVCDLCVEIPKPTDNGKTFTFKIRTDVKFHDGSPLTAADIVATFNEIIFPPPDVLSARAGSLIMVEKVEATDLETVVFRLKFATETFLPAIADPFNWVYEKRILDDPTKGPHWYEQNVMGSGPFKFVAYESGQSVTGARNPYYYDPNLPYLDGFTGIFADKEATRVAAIRADRAAIEFRGLPPSSRDELTAALGDQIALQESDWDVGSAITVNHEKPPFNDLRVRRALILAIDRWGGAPALSKVSIVGAVGGIVFPGSPLAATRDDLEQIAGYWPDIKKSRAEARRLLHEAKADGLSFDLLNRNVDQPYKYVASWLIDERSKVGLHVTQKVLPTGPWYEAMRDGNFDIVVEGPGFGIVNPVMDIQKFLPSSVDTENYARYEGPVLVSTYVRMLRESGPEKQRALMRKFEKDLLDTGAHAMWAVWWHRIVPYRAYVKGWKISPSHYINQDLARVWLDN